MTSQTNQAELDKSARRRAVEENYDALGHANEYSIHVWRTVMPEAATDAQVYGAVGAYEKRTGRFKQVSHELPPGFQSRAARKLTKIARIMWD